MNIRPCAHFTPPQCWMNDPNGCFFYGGTYHLYYQHNPFDIVWGPMHWGHATSKNLITWKHEAIALYPEGNKTMYSGSIVIDTHNTSDLFPESMTYPPVVAVYTRCHEDSGLQEQCLAYSLDGGFSFVQHPRNPVIANSGIQDFRDPKVSFHTPSKSWIMALAVHDAIYLYRSENLIEWEHIASVPATLPGHTTVVECPDFFQLPVSEYDGNRVYGLAPARSLWVLGCSFQSKAYIPTQRYQLGSFDGRTFTPLSTEWTPLNYGIDSYAAQTWHHPAQKYEKTQISWATHWAYANKTPMQTYRGVMSFPSLLRVSQQGPHYRVDQRITPGIYQHTHTFFSASCTKETVVSSEAAAQLIETELHNKQEAVLELSWSTDCFVRITIKPDCIVFDRSKAGAFFHSQESALATIPRLELHNETSTLLVLIDYTIIELFVHDSQMASYRVFPDSAPLHSIRLIPISLHPIPVRISAIHPGTV